MVRFRLGNEVRKSRYWEEEEKRGGAECMVVRWNDGSMCGRGIKRGKRERELTRSGGMGV